MCYHVVNYGEVNEWRRGMNSPEDIRERIKQLPQGNLTRKTIKGHAYTYLQWREDGKVRSRVVREEELPTVRRLIAERNRLERRLDAMRGVGGEGELFNLDVYTGEELYLMCASVSSWKERRICDDVRAYLQSSEPRVCVMYGLRRTGKSTAMLQAIAKMDEEDRGDAAFIEVKVRDTLDALLKDMKVLSRLGYRYVFVDEVTLLEDFSEGAAPLADVYARLGMRVVLSGTDSLSFWFAEGTSLYDRTLTIHTTWIPYREHARVLGTTSIDEYIRYGGTMHRGGRLSRSSFRDSDATYSYVDSAIAHNIQHGLEFYRDGRNMRNLVELWDADELTNVINRVVQQENHSFARRSIDRAFKSADLGSARQLLRARMADESPLDAYDIDVEGITASLMSALDILNPESAHVEVSAAARAEVRNWLHVIEVFADYEVRSLEPGSAPMRAETVTQPGLRYSQALELANVLRNDSTFAILTQDEQALVLNTIDADVLGRMLEEIVLYETVAARGGWEWRPVGEEPDSRLEVFKLSGNMLPSGQACFYEFDMVCYNHATRVLDLYEIKHSEKVALVQTRHLTNAEVVAALVDGLGAQSVGRHVLYRGQTLPDPLGLGIDYLNVEEYLLGL